MRKKDYKEIKQGISKTELSILTALKKSSLIVFTLRDIQKLTGISYVNQFASNLVKKGFLNRVKNNQYVLPKETNYFSIATEIFSQSYISLWSALSYYGFTTQQPKKIQLMTTKKQKVVRLQEMGIDITFCTSDRFFGYVKRESFTIADPEKCFIDSFAHPQKAGGFDEVLQCFVYAYKKLNKRNLYNHLKRYNSKALNARIGYILSELGYSINVPLPKEYVKLDRFGLQNGFRNKEWMVEVNYDIKK
ncbi:MAG: type IV toxin-antitoxin system AbiEi family antitoxin domain-containing protein [Candidatus Woesearchaeota archaeon]